MASRAISTLSLRSQIREDHLTCTICFEQFQKPKALPCLHTFCEDCLRDYVTSRGFETKGNFPCPVCREDTSIPSGGVQEFPDNYIILSLTDTVETAKHTPKKKVPGTIVEETSSLSEHLETTTIHDKNVPTSGSNTTQPLPTAPVPNSQNIPPPVYSEIAPGTDQILAGIKVDHLPKRPENQFSSNPQQNLPSQMNKNNFQPSANIYRQPSPMEPPISYPNLNRWTDKQLPDFCFVEGGGEPNPRLGEGGGIIYPQIPAQAENPPSDCLNTPCNHGLLLRVGQYGLGDTDFQKPYGLALGRNGEYVVTDRAGFRILVFSNTGFLLSRFTCNCKVAGAVMTKDNHILVAVSNAGKAIMRLYNFDGRMIATYGNFYQFDNPSGIAINSNNHVMITNIAGHNILMFTEQRKFSKKFGWKGSGDNHFQFPQFVCVNSKDDIIVSDSGNNCIKVFNSNGEFKRKFGTSGDKAGCLSLPMGVAVDSSNNIVVADAGNYRVEVFSSHGNHLKTVVEDTELISPDTKPLNVAVSAKQNIVVLFSGPQFAEIRVYSCNY